MPLTRRKAAFRGLGVCPRTVVGLANRQGSITALSSVVAFVDFPEGSDFSQQALWAAPRWVG
ncbi:hypothetical protein [Nostoc commune]|uniref:hypothetical protein n=1 Tax=Nostoc commune TaxID=1178 RepID=UPI002073D545|nr:hypothetical protein [Nostoc commune]